MSGRRVATAEVRQLLIGIAVLVCGWWLARAGLLVLALSRRSPLPDALWWLNVALLTTNLLAAGAVVVATRGLLRGSRWAWWLGLALLVVRGLEGLTLLRVSGVGAAVVVTGAVGFALLLAGRSQLPSFTPVKAEDAEGLTLGASRRWRGPIVAAATCALLVWYGLAGVNALIGAGRIKTADHPPCDSSTDYITQTQDLARWMQDEADAGRVPINGTATSVCSPGSWIPGTATGDINPGGVRTVRARLEQLGCVWHDGFCRSRSARSRPRHACTTAPIPPSDSGLFCSRLRWS